MSGRKTAGALLATAGIAVMFIELGRYWRYDHPIHPAPVLLGAFFSFVGFFMLDPREALQGGKFVVDSGVQIIGTLRRGGRRLTDTPVVTPPPVDGPAATVDTMSMPKGATVAIVTPTYSGPERRKQRARATTPHRRANDGN